LSVAEARSRNTRLRAVRVFGFEPPWKGPEVARFQAEFAHDALRYVDDAFDLALGGRPGDIELDVETPNDSVGQAIVRAAADVDSLLVLGGASRRRRPSAVVRYCLRFALCPVIVVPPAELARAWSKVSVRNLLREITPNLNASS
jgi:hypothetical protein